MDARELSQHLANQAASVAQYLLPLGQKQSGQWVCGGVDGKSGSSLSLCIQGPKAGIWKDFATGQGGDLLDLWQAVKGVALTDALKEARQWAGVRMPDKILETYRREANYPKPQLSPSTRLPACTDSAYRYLTEQRKLDAETLTAFKIMVQGNDVIYPSYTEGGELARWKAIGIERDSHGKKRMHSSKDSAPVLFGWQAFPKDSRLVVLCEGEIDCLTLHQLGFPTLSVPNGCGNLQWIDTEWERLQCFDDVVIAMDSDEAGQTAAKAIVQRLGVHRCRVVDWASLGIKDPNDGLQQGLPLEGIINAVYEAKSLDPASLKAAASFREEVLHRFNHQEESTGSNVPWPSLAQKYRVRKGELTILTGMNGSGKSQLLGQLMLHLMNQGERACIASMELRPVVTLERLLRQALATASPTEAYMNAGFDWLAEKLWLFTVTGTAKGDQLLEVFNYAHRRYGVTQFVVDSLMKCGLGEDDWNAQKAFVDKLCDFRTETGSHVWLVAHPRKGNDESSAPSKLDVKGTSTITDLADTVLSLWRNPKKRETVNSYNADADGFDAPDAMLTVCKQRDGGWEGRCMLWFDSASCQFMDDNKTNPRRYVPFSTEDALPQSA